MTVLDTLNFVAFNPLQNNNPIAVRRRKLIAKIDEQIQLVANKDYTPTQHKWVTDEHGNQRKVEVAKRVKRWWIASVVVSLLNQDAAGNQILNSQFVAEDGGTFGTRTITITYQQATGNIFMISTEPFALGTDYPAIRTHFHQCRWK